MEATGQLAGGVAHDFNNVLTAIHGYAHLGLVALPERGERVRSSFRGIQDSAERATQLTDQLMAFSRHRTAAPRVLSLSRLVFDLDGMLRRLIGEDIELVTLPGTELWMVKVAPGQVEQVLTNLVVNARDAMPDGGLIQIETANAPRDRLSAVGLDAENAADQVMIAVSDTGIGMSEEVKRRAFELFFTTKAVGSGTGLGLATCYAVISQSQGHMVIDSAPGRGTTVRVYLPRVEGADEAARGRPRGSMAQLPVGNETVLVVEDQDAIRRLVVEVLGEQSYEVLEASNGGEALRAENRGLRGIDLLLTDVVMPLMGGREIAENLLRQSPEMKVLFVSGYADEPFVGPTAQEGDYALLRKPFTPPDLAGKVRGVLDG